MHGICGWALLQFWWRCLELELGSVVCSLSVVFQMRARDAPSCHFGHRSNASMQLSQSHAHAGGLCLRLCQLARASSPICQLPVLYVLYLGPTIRRLVERMQAQHLRPRP